MKLVNSPSTHHLGGGQPFAPSNRQLGDFRKADSGLAETKE
ncbi:hypothetical protein [Streptococcus cuniculi]|nr:hypothetical protein [Streptococcus cuniculi]